LSLGNYTLGTCHDFEEHVKPTLGQYLASIRLDRKMSLRQVEEATEKEVSNAYLSQLENGKIQQPSPIVLNTLADIYGIDYLQLMDLAGYLPANKARDATQRHGRAATFAEHNLTQEEEGELLDFLKYLRTRKRK
jgi:HTH-type transcriptional regulator, competence development regulator